MTVISENELILLIGVRVFQTESDQIEKRFKQILVEVGQLLY